MKTVMITGLFAISMLATGPAQADWGNAQDIADQWGNGSNAFGGSGNPYSGGYHGTSPYRGFNVRKYQSKPTFKATRKPARSRR